MKFAKILRKKLHYDTLVAEQEIYILSLIQLLQRREAIKKQKATYDTQLKESEDLEKKSKERKEKFKNAKNVKSIKLKKELKSQFYINHPS